MNLDDKPVMRLPSPPLPPPSPSPPPPNPAPIPAPYVKIQYHPSSGLEDEYIPLGEYLKPPSPEDIPNNPNPASDTPWYPFASEADFSFAEFVINHRYTTKQINGLLSHLHQGVWCKKSKVSFKTFRDINKVFLEEDLSSIPVRFPLETGFCLSIHAS